VLGAVQRAVGEPHERLGRGGAALGERGLQRWQRSLIGATLAFGPIGLLLGPVAVSFLLTVVRMAPSAGLSHHRR
jgi:hypothetical protein